MKKDNCLERRAELAPLDVIRVETALSRYPVHRLAKQGPIAIELREATEEGETTLRWEIGHHSKYGQPGPLAYKVDTLIVNRRLEEAGRPIPRIVRLGSLKEIARSLTWAGTRTRSNVPSSRTPSRASRPGFVTGPATGPSGGSRSAIPGMPSYSQARRSPTAGRRTPCTSSCTTSTARSSTTP